MLDVLKCIHITSKSMMSEVIDKLEEEYPNIYMVNYQPLKEWMEKSGFIVFDRSVVNDQGFCLLICKDDDFKQEIVYTYNTQKDKCNEDHYNDDLKSGTHITFNSCKYYEAEDYVDSGFSIVYDIYDKDDNFITSVRSPQAFQNLYKKILETNETYISYVNGKKVVINEEHNIDYYDSIFVF